MLRRFSAVVILLFALPCVAQNGMGNQCTPAGTWYGGSTTAYQLIIAPSTPAGHYTFVFQGIYKEPAPTAIAAHVSGELFKNGKVYEGSMLSLSGDSSFVDQPPGMNGKMPDLTVGWVVMEMLDCDTIKNTIPFFGVYFASPTHFPPMFDTPGIWLPGSPATGVNWIEGGKVPLVDPPDVDLLHELLKDTPFQDKPIVETYHRLPKTVNPLLLHK